MAQELGRAFNTIRNEMTRGTVTQIKQGRKVELYLADTGENIYLEHRKHCCPKFKRLTCSDFIDYVREMMPSKKWSVDACVGDAELNKRFNASKMVCTKTLYNYIDGTKDKNDSVLLTLAERQKRYYIVQKIKSKTTQAVLNELRQLKVYFGEQFNQVFKSISSDNGLGFAELSQIEHTDDVKVYFTHPYPSSEGGTNERHNGMLRRFLPKGSAINSYTIDEIAFVEEWCNTLSRKLFNYQIPEKLFEDALDSIYAT